MTKQGDQRETSKNTEWKIWNVLKQYKENNKYKQT